MFFMGVTLKPGLFHFNVVDGVKPDILVFLI
jgi:hypothetical protein